MATGLDVSNVVRVSVTIEALAAQQRNFGAGMIISSSPVVDIIERRRFYAGLDGLAQDCGTNSPEYQAATLFFGQDPQPAGVFLARWAQSPTAGLIHGAVLSPSQQLLNNFTSVTNGALKLSVDGTARTITSINLSGALNLNGVADLIQTALSATVSGATVRWDSVQKRFTVTSGTTGAASSVSYATAPASGTDLGPLLHLTAADASAPVLGVVAESLASAVATLADMGSDWYAALVATQTPPSDADHLAAAALIEGLSQARLYGVTITNSNVLDPTTVLDLASQLKTLGYKRTWTQYSGSNPYAATSFFGRAATVNFQGSNTTITMMFKREPGVVAETITESQAATLKAKNCNVFVNYNNSTAILQHGVMANGYYFDEVHGTDWLQNEIQTNVYNLLYSAANKVPQTDAGMDQIKAEIKAACERGVNNGLIAPGLWTGPNIGPLKTGQALPTGFFVYGPPVTTQTAADRAARRSVPFQVAIKLAGAVHAVVISVQANR